MDPRVRKLIENAAGASGAQCWTPEGVESLVFEDPADVSCGGVATCYGESGIVRLELTLTAERAAEVIAYVRRGDGAEVGPERMSPSRAIDFLQWQREQDKSTVISGPVGLAENSGPVRAEQVATLSLAGPAPTTKVVTGKVLELVTGKVLELVRPGHAQNEELALLIAEQASDQACDSVIEPEYSPPDAA